ncbi:hypothetical protein L6164_034066 [Bauhinia variegata]|uniref:Uncharacterized protein n=1 Tax=Bauhinia variegata TaxID=167791 RepID=A0ACB9KTL0_BAUVA|nr:hypothetical protein L6164_034066 [Bauhinia variegata]
MINNILCFLLCLLLLPSLSKSKYTSKQCSPKEKKALLQIRKELNNSDYLSTWTSNNDCCDFIDVNCDQTHHVTRLTLFGDQHSGRISPAIGDLNFLESIVLVNLPNVYGPIPPTIAKITKLEDLTISNTNVSGQIPDSLGRLPRLLTLDLTDNKLSGPIPASLSQLRKLLFLYLTGNQLTGPIPDSFGSFKQHPSLFLGRNQLTGKIPPSLAAFDISILDLSGNKLTGDASLLFTSNKTTQQTLYLSSNYLSFNLTKVDHFPPQLTTLDLSHNNIYGSLPNSLTTLDLVVFNVSYNRLCGKIPVGGKLQNFDSSSYNHNKCLCGSPLHSCK